MPLYEYRCGGCGRKVTLFVRTFDKSADVCCPNCNSSEMKRLFSSFRVTRTDMDRYADILGDSQLVKRMEANDPKASSSGTIA